MRSESSVLRAPPRGLCFPDTVRRPLRVSFQPSDAAADFAAAATLAGIRLPTRLHDLPETPTLESIVLRIRVD